VTDLLFRDSGFQCLGGEENFRRSWPRSLNLPPAAAGCRERSKAALARELRNGRRRVAGIKTLAPSLSLSPLSLWPSSFSEDERIKRGRLGEVVIARDRAESGWGRDPDRRSRNRRRFVSWRLTSTVRIGSREGHSRIDRRCFWAFKLLQASRIGLTFLEARDNNGKNSSFHLTRAQLQFATLFTQ
jgi:hypothetical protein